MGIDVAVLKKGLGAFPKGVTVVTTEMAGVRAGMTVSAFSSLSLDPPLVLVCIDRKSRFHPVIAEAGRFAVNVLSASQEELSNRFSSRAEDKFEGVEVRTGALGLPLLPGSLATLECEVRESLPGGDHSIFVGEVRHAEVAPEGEPLIYWRSGYRRLAR